MLFARMIPFVVYEFGQQRKRRLAEGKECEGKLRGELRALIQIWEIKFIFDDCYTKGLLFLMDSFERRPNNVPSVHAKLKIMGDIPDDREGDLQLERLCFDNGIPLI
jgi:hypothetical protein